jgi:hypothetical protein
MAHHAAPDVANDGPTGVVLVEGYLIEPVSSVVGDFDLFVVRGRLAYQHVLLGQGGVSGLAG